MPMRRATAPGTVEPFANHPAGAHLTFQGGPVLASVKVNPIYWNSSTTNQSNLSSFYGAVVNSPLYDMLKQYNCNRGSFGAAFVDNQTNKNVTDAQAQAEVAKLIDSGKVPANTVNSYYPIHFDPGTTVTDSGGTQSCTQWCAYHGTFVHNGMNVQYGIIPDQSGACAGGCGDAGNATDNLYEVSSHELVEATTDPAVGLNNVAWYDNTNGEIGDICANQGNGPGHANGFAVQLEWSNSDNDCVDHSGTTCTPNCTGRTCGSDGCGGSCGTCPSGQSCGANGTCSGGCTPQCTGKNCGPDGCGGTCGTCPQGSTCGSNGTCGSTCTPNCTGKTCGPDGCGGTCGSCPSGQTCSSGGTCQGGGGCSHPICSQGSPLTSSCDPCAGKICAADSYCCNTAWDSICVGEVASICGKSCGGGTCAHPICSQGSKLKSSCDPCATKICNADSYCCNTAWDSICVGEVGSICGQTCN